MPRKIENVGTLGGDGSGLASRKAKVHAAADTSSDESDSQVAVTSNVSEINLADAITHPEAGRSVRGSTARATLIGKQASSSVQDAKSERAAATATAKVSVKDRATRKAEAEANIQAGSTRPSARVAAAAAAAAAAAVEVAITVPKRQGTSPSQDRKKSSSKQNRYVLLLLLLLLLLHLLLQHYHHCFIVSSLFPLYKYG